MASDVANTITAISAVAGVIVAVVIGLKAVRIASQDRDRGAHEFLYSQVDALLQSGLGLTSAASELAPQNVEGAQAERDVDRQAEDFQSRLQILRELRLVGPTSEAADACNQFAHMLVVVAKCSHVLLRDGRGVLAPTIADGEHDGTEVLRDLDSIVHATPEDSDSSGDASQRSRRWSVSPVFDSSPEAANLLRAKVADATWNPSVNQSLRLIVPWLRTELGWSYVQAFLEDGTPLMVMDSQWGGYFDETTLQVIEPPHPYPDAAEWLKQWPGRLWQAEDHGDDPIDDPQAWIMSPEELIAKLFNDLRSDFVVRISALVREMREESPLRPEPI